MSTRQLEHSPQRLDSIVEDLQACLTQGDEERTSFSHALPSPIRLDARSIDELAERLSTCLQTAIAVQLAPLSDDLPGQLTSLVQASIATPAPVSPFTVADFVRELEKHEGRSMASMAARLTAGLQSTMANELAALTGDLPARIAAAVAAAVPNTAIVDQSTLLPSDREQSLDHELLDVLRSEVADLRSLLAAKEIDALMVDELRAELARVRMSTSIGEIPIGSNPEDYDEVLREQLEHASYQIIELRTKNEDLAEQISQLQINTAPHGPTPHLGHEGLSWEERKRLLLQQLDAEVLQDDGPDSENRRLEISEILRTTTAELARRDREIDELRSLLQQQSHAREGIAIGAAAVAQLIESDELVQEEREKLRVLQRSWDEKLRQAEIDLSMERARLARERLHLEELKQQVEQDALSATAATQEAPNSKTADARTRKWLGRLGLKDEL